MSLNIVRFISKLVNMVSMYSKSQRITSFILLLLVTSSFATLNTSSSKIAPEDQFEQKPILNAINATSSTEYFNETSHPRYNLVTRPIDLILYPNKGNPKIVSYNESFEIIVDAASDTTSWEFNLKKENTTITANILSSNFVNDKWYFEVESLVDVSGLYDLQLNCSIGSDYQTHSVNLIEERTYPFNFIHISDSHFPSYDIYNATDIDLKLIQELKQLDVEFAIFTGDLIEGASAQMFVNPETGISLAASVQIKLGLWAFDLLDMPVFIIGGNHDLDSSVPLPDDPPVEWRRYLGSYPIMTFDYLNWSFLGYSVTRTGLSASHLDDVKEILDDISTNPNVMFYHSDYNDQATNLRKSYNIEVMLYGHEHNYEQYVSKNTLYYCQSPMFYNESTVFTVLNSTAILLNGSEYDFSPLLVYPEPTETSSETVELELLSILTVLLLLTIKRKRRTKLQ